MGAIPENMAYVGGTPWHGIGKQLNAEATGAEMLAAAGLDWRVEQAPLMAVLNADEAFEVPGQFATYRTDTHYPFGVVGEKYEIVQNEEAFLIPDEFVRRGLAGYHTAGQLYGGRLVWSLARMGEAFIGSDKYESYLLFVNRHDGEGAVQLGRTTVRVVCQNTCDAALRNLTNRVSLRHTASVHDRIEAAMEGFTALRDGFADEMALYRQLAATPMTLEDFRRFSVGFQEDLHGATDTERKARARIKVSARLEHYFLHGAGNHGRTALEAFHAVTDDFDHTKVRAKYEAGKAAAQKQRDMASTLFGDAYKAKGKALARLLK